MRLAWESFNLWNEYNILRLICGLFFIPHIYGKFFVPAALEFFIKAGFKPPAFWMYLAGAIECFLAIGLIFDIYTPYVAAIAAFHLCVAAGGVYKVSKNWLWHIFGVEFCIFWSLCCVVVAMHSYKLL